MTIVNLGAKRLQGLKSDRVSDSLGSSADGTNNGVTLDTTNEKLGTGCYSFDGTDKATILSATAGEWNFLHNNSDFSIAFWLKLNATPNETQGILGTGTGGSSIGYEIAFNPSTGVMYNNIENGSGATSNINSSSGFVPVNTTTWYHYVITFSNGVWNIYRNGANNETATDVISWSSSNHSRSMELGNANANTAGDRKDLTGLVDDMGIWDKVLPLGTDEDTEGSIKWLYNTGTGRLANTITGGLKAYYSFDSLALDLTPSFVSDFSNSSAWTQVGTQITVSSDRVNFSSALCGTDRRVWKALGFTLDDTFVAEWEFSLTDSGSSQAQPFALTAGTAQLDNSTTNQDSIYFKSSSSGYQLACKDGTTNSQSSANSYTNGTTLYARLVRDGTSGTLSIYSDSTRSTLVSSATHTIPASVTGLNTIQCAVDAVQGDTRTISGTLSNVKIYNGVSTVIGCQNNHSSTSPLEALTGVRTNTIFEETDTAKYKWWDGSEWKMDGTEAKVFRGIFAGGYKSDWGTIDSMEYITIPTTGNATDFGDLQQVKSWAGGGTNGTRGVFMGGRNASGGTGSYVDEIDYVTIATKGNASDFGNLYQGRQGYAQGVVSSDVRAVQAGGLLVGSETNIMGYVTIDTTGNSSDFGDINQGYGYCGCSDKVRGTLSGHRQGSNSEANPSIYYITIASTGNATDSGYDLQHSNMWAGAGTQDATRGIMFGGYRHTGTSAKINDIAYITIQSLSNATDFGDLSAIIEAGTAVTDNTWAVCGHHELTNGDMEYVTIQTTGNSSNFGDMEVAKSHGGDVEGY